MLFDDLSDLGLFLRELGLGCSEELDGLRDGGLELESSEERGWAVLLLNTTAVERAASDGVTLVSARVCLSAWLAMAFGGYRHSITCMDHSLTTRRRPVSPQATPAMSPGFIGTCRGRPRSGHHIQL